MTYLASVWKILSNSPGLITVTIGNMLVLFCFLRPRWQWYIYPFLVSITFFALPILYKFGTQIIDSANANSILLTVLGYWGILIILVAFGEGFFKSSALTFSLCILNRMFVFCGYILHIPLNALTAGNMDSEVSVTIFIAVMYTLISLVCWLTLREKGRHLFQTQLHSHNWVVLACVAFTAKLIIDFCSDYVFNLNPYSDNQLIWAMIALCAFVVAVLILYLYSAITMLKHSQLKAAAERLTFEKEAQQRYYETQLHNQEEIRRTKHDINGHLTTISHLLADDNKDEAVSYLSALSKYTENHQKVLYSDDLYINAVVTNYAEIFAENHITFEHDIKLGKIENHHVEICLTLNNALQNVLEASLKLPPKQRYVKLQIKTKQSRFLLRITNLFDGELIMNGGIPRSTKESEGHGYGLISIRDAVESLGGFMICKNENNMFILDVAI